MTIRKGGKAQEVSVEEALQHKTYRKAIDGDKASRRVVLKMIEKREAYIEKLKPESKGHCKVKMLKEPKDPDNANQAMLILGMVYKVDSKNKTSGHQPAVILEPWVVQAALSRRRGGSKLTKEEIKAIQYCTREVGEIKWPRGTQT